jgi:hypothetical protein
VIKNGNLKDDLFFDNGYQRPKQKFYEEYYGLLQELDEDEIKYTKVDSKLQSVREIM